MSISFLNLMVDLFPNISKETMSQLHKLIRQKDLYANWLFSSQNLSELCQGDVMRKLPIVFFGEKGKVLKKDLPALLLNNTCDMQVDNGEARSKFTSVIPLFPLNDYLRFFQNIPNYARAIRQNVITDKFYVGDVPGEHVDYIADLSMLSSLATKYLHGGIKKGTIRKVATLSANGYYYFLAKLTLHLMRRESEDLTREELIRRLN